MKYLVWILSALLWLSCEAEGEDISWIEVDSGTCSFGSDQGMENEGPKVHLPVDAFYLSETEVSNAQFAEFVEETDYKTDAEKSGGSMIFQGGKWKWEEGVNWRHPLGASSCISNGMNLPVVHVSYNDAQAYCRWKGVRLPTEVEFEFVAQNNQMLLETINIDWNRDEAPRTGAVHAQSKSNAGFHHLQGNVWEWCADVYNYEIHDKWKMKTPEKYSYSGQSFDPLKESEDTLRVIKGGSFLCQPGYCAGYLSYARQSCEQSASYFHIGFRVAKDKK